MSATLSTEMEADSMEGLPSRTIESRIASVGQELASSLGRVIESVPGHPHATMALARALNIDKVLASRILKALRFRDPIALVHHIPGPDPLRRLLKAAAARRVDRELIAAAQYSIDEFEALIRDEAGDRSSLDAMISAWLPEVRQQFELSRKQSAFKAMSQLRGTLAELNLGVVLLSPNEDGRSLDVVWVVGLLGLRRLRPNVPVKFTTRRDAGDPDLARMPRTLSGEPAESLEGLRLEEFSSKPPPPLNVQRVGEVVQYSLGGNSFGTKSAVDIVMAEANYQEIDRFIPAESGRKAHLSSDIATPSKLLVFDVFLHEDVFPGSSPELHVYDTVFQGSASVNDRTRDIDRLDFMETVSPLGRGIDRCRINQMPVYPDLLSRVFESLGWQPQRFRGHRCRIEYPIYGSQVMMAFQAPPEP